MKIIKEKPTRGKRRSYKIAIASSIISSFFILSSTIAFSDVDINALMTNWYNKKLEIAKLSLEKSTMTELEAQKIRLREDVEGKMRAAEESLDGFTESQKESRKNAIADYANNIISTMTFSNEGDKAQITQRLDNITSESMKAIDSLIDSYKPPVEVYVPEPAAPETEESEEVDETDKTDKTDKTDEEEPSDTEVDNTIEKEASGTEPNDKIQEETSGTEPNDKIQEETSSEIENISEEKQANNGVE